MKKLAIIVTLMCTFVLQPSHARIVPDDEYIQKEVLKMLADPEYADTVDFCLWYAMGAYKVHEMPPEWLNDSGHISLFKVAMEVEAKRLEWEKLQVEKE